MTSARRLWFPRLLRAALRASLLLLLASPLIAAEPNVRNLNVRGLQVGGTTTIAIDGDDLGKAPKLFLPFAAKQTLKPGNTDKQATFEVALDAGVIPGLYHLRVATDQGVSLPVVIGVDRLAHKPLGPSIEALPAAVYGNLTGSSIVETKFEGKVGEKVMVEVEAQRLGSKLRPVVHLYGPKKLQVAWAWGIPSLAGDSRLEATLPETGAYTIAVHDAEYAGQNPGFFRLKVGTFGYVDQVFPPVAGRETKAFELLGPTTGRVERPAARGNLVLLPWPKDLALPTGPRPWAEVSTRPEFLAPSVPGKPMELPAGPIAVSGKLTLPNEEHRYRVAVAPKTKVRFEAFAERIGSPIDTAIVIRNDAGGVLAQAEDSPGTLDPVLEYAVPDKVTAVTVGVVDSAGGGGPRGCYRLVIDPVKPEGQGDFHVSTPAQRLALPAGGRLVVPVYVDRRGYGGKLSLTAEDMPAGVKLDGTTIALDADGTLVTIAGTPPAAALTQWKAANDRGETRAVFVKGHPLERLQPWLASELSIAPTTLKAEDFAIDWRNLPADAGLKPAGKLALPFTVKRKDPAAPVRVVLLTSQNPPLTNNQPDPNRAIRLEKPTDLPAKASDGEASVLLPADLPADSYQLALQAELLSADKQRVLATAFTPVRALAVKLPVVVKLEGATKIEAKLDAKKPATVEVKGVVERLNGFTGDVTVSLAGLPPGVAVPPPATLKVFSTTFFAAAETKFAFKLTLPPSVAPTEAKLKLLASVVADPKQPNVRVKSRDVEFVLSIIPAPVAKK